MRHWLLKTEPGSYSIDDLRRDGKTHWDGVRNYQARNSMREMAVGDAVLVYHSNADPPGVVGLGRIVGAAYPDPSALDPKSKYYDEKATKADPRWSMVDVAFVEQWKATLGLDELKADPQVDGMEIVRKGTRLSVTPVSAEHYARVVALGRAKGVV